MSVFCYSTWANTWICPPRAFSDYFKFYFWQFFKKLFLFTSLSSPRVLPWDILLDRQFSCVDQKGTQLVCGHTKKSVSLIRALKVNSKHISLFLFFNISFCSYNLCHLPPWGCTPIVSYLWLRSWAYVLCLCLCSIALHFHLRIIGSSCYTEGLVRSLSGR